MSHANLDDVREFLTALAAQAEAALGAFTIPGVMQLSRLHPSSEKLVPTRQPVWLVAKTEEPAA
jgi:hypothetical protein